MALIARVSGDSWDWREEGAEDLDDGPLTSRSPSFVRIAGAEPVESFADGTLDCITESSRHTTSRPPADDVHAADAMLRRWSDLEVMARTRALRLEETTLRIHDRRLERVARSVLDDATAVTDALRVLQLMWSPSSMPANAGGPMSPSFPVVQHVFEWLSGLLLRSDERLVAMLEERELVIEDLDAVEYSSLFVRSIIDPMMAEAIRAHESVNDDLAATSLREVRERVLWLNWTARSLAEERGPASGTSTTEERGPRFGHLDV